MRRRRPIASKAAVQYLASAFCDTYGARAAAVVEASAKAVRRRYGDHDAAHWLEILAAVKVMRRKSEPSRSQALR